MGATAVGGGCMVPGEQAVDVSLGMFEEAVGGLAGSRSQSGGKGKILAGGQARRNGQQTPPVAWIGHLGALHRRGLIHQRRGRWDAATADLTQAIRAAPTVAEPHYALSQVERRRGNKAAADRAAHEFKRLDRLERSP